MKVYNKNSVWYFICLILSACNMHTVNNDAEELVYELPSFNPEKYVCYLVHDSIVVDGALNDAAWEHAPWTGKFVDIEGALKPMPSKDTKVKMLWDKDFLYIAAEMKEDHIWAQITQHDAVIFYDNDFEVFIDPDGDTHHYMELELNALNTHWDLMISKPYRDNGLVIDNWEIQGIKKAVKVDGTLNDPSDRDIKWTVEIALPWKVLNECAERAKMPKDGIQWRINFSRVEWTMEIKDGRYVKKKDAAGKRLAEDNWVWSPQGVIAMHRPETWGYVQFSEKAGTPFYEDADEAVKWALRQVYYRQKVYAEKYHFFTDDYDALRLNEVKLNGKSFTPEMEVTKVGFLATYPSITHHNAIWVIQNDGKIWLKKFN